MDLRSADLRFVVPHEVRRAVVLGADRDAGAARLAGGLARAGVDLLAPAGVLPEVDLVVAPAGEHRPALELAARTHLLLGPGSRTPGRSSRPLLVHRPGATPATVVPLRSSLALRHHLRDLAPARGGRGRLRDAALLAAGRGPSAVAGLLPHWSSARVVRRRGADLRPGLLRAAAEVVPALAGEWVLALGAGDELQRAVFHVLRPGRPGWVVKFSRVAGYDSSMVRDEVGLALVAAAGPATRAHAPAHLGRFELHGVAASVESAGAGPQLLQALPDGPDDVLEAVVAWVQALGAETRRPASALGPELSRLQGVLERDGLALAAPADLVQRVAELPAVLQHNDLGSWNILSDGRSFTVVDWESASPAGLPLWDLIYFAADVLARLDGPADPAVLLARAVDVFSGRSPRSALLFRWVRTAAAALGLPLEAVGPTAALCWLHHGQSAGRRQESLAGAAPAPLGHLALMAPAWFDHPGLGATWPALFRS